MPPIPVSWRVVDGVDVDVVVVEENGVDVVVDGVVVDENPVVEVVLIVVDIASPLSPSNTTCLNVLGWNR